MPHTRVARDEFFVHVYICVVACTHVSRRAWFSRTHTFFGYKTLISPIATASTTSRVSDGPDVRIAIGGAARSIARA